MPHHVAAHTDTVRIVQSVHDTSYVVLHDTIRSVLRDTVVRVVEPLRSGIPRSR